ncbi:hypothetical protein C8J56DRAFT_1000265 [Mycena floridula]|nr:hypothetical protein C8J56DRAFT_1000265 [Mycena floridula]
MSSPAGFKGDFLTSKDKDFSPALDRCAANARREAKVVAYVKDAQDVVLALKYAKDNKLPIAVRGGGHSVSGASSVQDGLVIDLSRYINGCRIDVENKLAFVGGGAIWKTVEETAIQHELATISGSILYTGVAGLALGGGYGALTGEHGLAVDNIVQATVVVADGLILTANEKENSDLFFGIRGGSSNFGVCTELVLRLYHQRRTVYAGNLIFPPSMLASVMKLHEDRKKAGEVVPKELAVQMLLIAPDGNPIVLLSLFYNGSEAEGRAHFKKYLDLGPHMDTTAEIPYEKIGTLQEANTKPGGYAYMSTTAVASLSIANNVKVHGLIHKFYTETKIKAILGYELFSHKKLMEVPLDSTAFRRDDAVVVAIICRWEDPAPEKTALAREMTKQIRAILHEGEPSSLSASARLGYGNIDGDAAEKNDQKVALVFGSNYPKLQALKKKHDPEQVFNRWFSIVPAA